MHEEPLVFRDDARDPDATIRAVQAAPRRLAESDADVRLAARARAGEVWSPQLLPYKEWESGAGRDEAPGAAMLPASRIGLLYSGARSMGIGRDRLESVLEQAVANSALARPASSAVLAPDAPSADAASFSLRDAVAVREDDGGFALVGFDLKRLARAAGGGRVTAVLPASVGGVPIVRVTAEALARRFVQGVEVGLLAIPDTVRRIDASALSRVAAEHIHFGAGLAHLGDQPCDLAAVSPRLVRRAYSVAAGNGRYAACGAGVVERATGRLVCASAPYAAREELPAQVAGIGRAALCEGCPAPRTVVAPASLARVESRVWDEAVWVCADDAPAAASLRTRGVRVASARLEEYDGCLYDFDERGAVLVAGPQAPQSASRRFAAAAEAAVSGAGRAPAPASDTASPFDEGRLVLPDFISGRPLVRIGPRALVQAPATLVLPRTLRRIDDGNACRGVERAVLPEGLESIGAHCFCSRRFAAPVSIPRSVRGIGPGCFEYALCRLEGTGSVVHVPADQLLTCFLDHPGPAGVPFDFAAYDALAASGASLPDPLGALVHRIADPHAPSDDVRQALVDRLRAQGPEAYRRVARDGECAEVEALFEAGFIDEGSFDAQIELLRSCNRTECVALLMELRCRASAPGVVPVRARDRFAL